MHVDTTTENDSRPQEDTTRELPAPTVPRDRTLEPTAADPGELFRRQQAVVAMGRRAIAPPETAVLVQDAAALIAEVLDVEFSAVAEVATDSTALVVRLASRQPDDEEPRPVVGRLTMSGEHSMAAYALQVAHPVLTDDLSAEGRFQDRFLRGVGIRSALAMPLRGLNRAFGTLIACSAKPQQFDAQDVPFAEVIGHLTGTSIARSQAEKSFAEEKEFTRGLLQTMEALVVVLDAEGRILRINQACERTTDFRLADLSGRFIWDVFATPADAELHHAMFARLCQGEAHVLYESALLTKHAEQRRIRWSSSAMPDYGGTDRTILVTGTDITEQFLAKQATQTAEVATQPTYAAANPIAIALPNDTLRQLLSCKNDSPPFGADESLKPLNSVPRERRRQPRRAYSYRQGVAPVLDGKLPPRACFREMQCYDIAAGGIALLAEKRPESNLLVIALGSPPRLTYVFAQVVHVSTILHQGEPMYRIGCKYTGRAPY